MTNLKNRLMIYGANGYSARLIIEELISKNIYPVLAGRNETAIRSAAQKYNCDFRIFGLEDENEILKSIGDIQTLLNCAGPFRNTAKELIESCILSKTNYSDITGEIPVFHLAFSMSQKAMEAGVALLPGAGFDIIPTDCLAKRLSEKMPGAVHLKLGFKNIKGNISRGTLLTSLEFLGGKGLVRRNGSITESAIGEYSVKIKNDKFSFNGISIPWGDVYTCYYSTKIPNAEVYMGLPILQYNFKPMLLQLMKLLSIPFIKNISKKYISRFVTGPDKNKRDSTQTFIWGRVENSKNEVYEEAYQVMEGYNLTAKGAVEICGRLLNNEVKPGAFTPSLAFGCEFMDRFVVKRIF